MVRAGQIIQSRHFPESVEIKSIEPMEGNMVILEALGRKSQRYFEMMLEVEELDEFKVLYGGGEGASNITARDVQHFLQLRAFEAEEKYSGTLGLGSQQLLPLPHQIDAVYRRMLQMPQVRMLLADDPGAGKTIMAGMLLKEMMARNSVERVLILVPPLVLTQWQEELREKFAMDFMVVNRHTLKNQNKNPFMDNNLVLASMYWSIRDDIKVLLNEASFDVVIIDEAHKMAAYTHGKVKRKVSRTKLYQMGETLLRQVEHCLLLTATPHKGDMENFRHLMALLDRDVFSAVTAGESLRDKANPFMIRRVKENLKDFDETPLFPKRTTKTIGYELTPAEMDFYDQVTEYARDHFNRAINQGNQSTVFAMMLLQRRLSSSIEAIGRSLDRRKNRLEDLLEKTLQQRKKFIANLDREWNDYFEELDPQEQALMEEKLGAATCSVDTEELSEEILVLQELIRSWQQLKLTTDERKYQELEDTIFGAKGLLQNGEKILIFSEYVDTLESLREKLQARIPLIAEITGRLSIEERRRQVDFFRNEAPIMLATDAGGESINLQFCNQMINYDIPWNPNRLEQRMGRIHRIGQRNEVHVFNLVAANTREGDVMMRLLTKLEQMREDLGKDLVYDFIGDVLEDDSVDLPSLMQEALVGRETLDQQIERMEKTLSEEHQRLLKIFQEESLALDIVEMKGMRKDHYKLMVEHIPDRCYAEFCHHILTKQRIRIFETHEGKMYRIDRIPKHLRDFGRKNGTEIEEMAESYPFTSDPQLAEEKIPMVDSDHPLFHFAKRLTEIEMEKTAMSNYQVSYPCQERLIVDISQCTVTDGTGKEQKQQILYNALRENGNVISVDPYWIFSVLLTDELTEKESQPEEECQLRQEAFKSAIKIRESIKNQRNQQLEKVKDYLLKTFTYQSDKILDKLLEYQEQGHDPNQVIRINQLNAQLKDIEIRKQERLSELERQSSIITKPPKRIALIELAPKGVSSRIIPEDVQQTIEEYERSQGRMIVKTFGAFALVDFYSERYNGEPHFIIVKDGNTEGLSEEHKRDLQEIAAYTHVYTMIDGKVAEQQPLGEQ